MRCAPTARWLADDCADGRPPVERMLEAVQGLLILWPAARAQAAGRGCGASAAEHAAKPRAILVQQVGEVGAREKTAQARSGALHTTANWTSCSSTYPGRRR